mgnify:CR=1 FL=1
MDRTTLFTEHSAKAWSQGILRGWGLAEPPNVASAGWNSIGVQRSHTLCFFCDSFLSLLILVMAPKILSALKKTYIPSKDTHALHTWWWDDLRSVCASSCSLRAWQRRQTLIYAVSQGRQTLNKKIRNHIFLDNCELGVRCFVTKLSHKRRQEKTQQET